MVAKDDDDDNDDDDDGDDDIFDEELEDDEYIDIAIDEEVVWRTVTAAKRKNYIWP